MPPSSPIAPRSEEQPHILLVDDDELVLGAYERLLRAAGYKVTRAENGRTALRRTDEMHFDLVVSDILMPDVDGLSFLRSLRNKDAELPVVLVTGGPTISGAAQAVEYGATRYLRKPLEWTELQTVAEQAIRSGKLARALRSGALAEREASLRLTKASFNGALASLWMAYQPIVHAHSQEVFAYEALMRPTRPSLPNPQALLKAAELTEGLPALGKRVRELVAIDAQAPNAGLFFVNLHPQDLLDEELFRADMPLTPFAGRIVLELTERAPLDQVVDAVDRIERLRRMGFRIAIDDLGAGFAGLATLALVQPDFVKIDMSLVRGIDRDERRRKIVRSLVALCHDMGVKAVAEGVETVDERDALVACGCELLQGYLFGRPGRLLLPDGPAST